MSADEPTPTPKPRKRRAAKASGQQDAERVKLTLYLPAKLARKFAVHATMLGMDKSGLFEQMVKATCRRFVTTDREKGEGDAEDADAA